MRAWLCVLAGGLALLGQVRSCAQTAEATLTGEVRGPQRQMLGGVRVFAENQETGGHVRAVTNEHGQYLLQFIPPGRYLLRVQSAGYRPIERPDVTLHVAERAVADFDLQALPPDLAATLPGLPSDVATRGALGLIYGPDAQAKMGVVDDRAPPMTDATSSTVSGVIDERRVNELLLAGRSIYTLFVLLPGVTSDNATQRGLGFSVNGFRVSSSNYLLDGVDNNNLQSSRDGTGMSPDSVQEYRLSTANFTAEYGRGAFVANVISRSGGNTWHASLFEYLFNEKLNANSFQNNASGRARVPFKEHQFGFAAGGPIQRDRLFAFATFEALEASTIGSAQGVTLPRPNFIAQALIPEAQKLFVKYPALPLSGAQPLDANRTSGVITPHTPINTISAAARVDYELRPDRDRLFVRWGSLDQTLDDVIFSPYRGLGMSFSTADRNVAAGYTHRFSSAAVNEAKFGLGRSAASLLPAAQNLPRLVSFDQTALPGNPDSGSEQSYSDTVLHAVDNFSLLRARHHLVFGGEYRPSWDHSLLGSGRVGTVAFADLENFAANRAYSLSTTVDRFSTDAYRQPDYTRHYRQNEFAAFIEDNWRFSRRLTLNLGLRYEYFGVPHNSRRDEDVNYYLGTGRSANERVAAGALRRTTDNAGPLRGMLYRPDRNNVAPRFGFAFDVFGNSRTVLRGGYGIYYDRLFNLLWSALRQNNSVSVTFPLDGSPILYSVPAASLIPPGPVQLSPSAVFLVDGGLRTPYVQTWLVGLQHSLSRNLLVEVNQIGSLGRKLPARDVINRAPDNPAVSLIRALTNQGSSSFAALETSMRRRFSRGLDFQVSHTWSHAIDNQGDPLVLGQFTERAFQQEFNAAGDRGNADFDQRHNLVFHFLWALPRLRSRGVLGRIGSGWQAAGIAGYRSGFPLTVYSAPLRFVPGTGLVMLARADFLGGDPAPGRVTPAPGGVLLLDCSRFTDPPPERLGNTGRNEFRGPGFWNYDLSLGREFAVRHLGETGRVQFRAEVFNAFNHANLGNPDTRLFLPSFGRALYGRSGTDYVSLGTSPLNEFPRRVQLVLRLSF